MRITLHLCVFALLTSAVPDAFGRQTAFVPHGEHINVVFKAVSDAEVFQPKVGKSGTWPGLILVSDDTGLDDFLRSQALDFASKGFLVVAVDPHRNAPEAMPKELREKRIREELGGAVTYLNNWMMTPERVGIVGYGVGGTISLDFALKDASVRAVVVNYGALRVQDPGVTQANFALLANFGALDPDFSSDQIAQAVTALHTLHVSTEIKIYSDAGRAFDRLNGSTYKAEDAADEQKRTAAFMTNHLEKVTK
jgi:dienelactone hydrolase